MTSPNPSSTLDFTGSHEKYTEGEHSQHLRAGTLLHEFKIVSVLGAGAFGVTYLAEDTNLHLQVAIKEFFPSSIAVRGSDTGTVVVKGNSFAGTFEWGKKRFIQEAQTLACFKHPNIVHVLRYFEENGTCYMVMAYEQGQSLEELLSSDKTSWGEDSILELLQPLLDGVAHVHQAGFLHRDIKPSNIYIREKDGSPVLLDFGSARAALIHHTQPLTALVSPGYGPLEQYFDDGTQGAWTDIYSIGAVIYRIVTGSQPPAAPSRVKKDSMVPMIFAGNKKYSPAFLRAVDQALSMDEEKRPQSIADWLPQLRGEVSESQPASSNSSELKNPKQTAPSELAIANTPKTPAKRSFYNILQVSNDAGIGDITDSYLRIKSKNEAVGDPDARNELLFVKHAYETLSDTNSRKIYDKQLEQISTSPKEAPLFDISSEIFIAKKHEYFARKWKILEQKKTHLSWNWAASLLGCSWMAYRKMYLKSFIVFGIDATLAVSSSMLNFPLWLSWGVTIGIGATLGLLGNYWYMLHVEKNVKEITAAYPPEHVDAELILQGGTNIGAAIGFYVLPIILGAALFLNGYIPKVQQDYIAEARFSEIWAGVIPVKTTVEMFASDNEGLTKLTSNPAENWTALGLSAASLSLPSVISAMSVGAEGVITAIVAPGVIGSTSCGNVTYTPSFDRTRGMRWVVTTTCPEPAPTIVSRGNAL